jgi:hypothetical protein
MDMQSTLGTAGRAFKNIFKGLSDEMQMCIQNCVQCAQVCEQMIQHCLKQGGPHSAPSHIRLLQDCAEICAVSANFMLRESEFHGRTCAVCADVCLSCAEDCEKMKDDEMMRMCAEVCRRCAESCQKMATTH